MGLNIITLWVEHFQEGIKSSCLTKKCVWVCLNCNATIYLVVCPNKRVLLCNILLLVTVYRYPDVEQTISKRNSASSQKSSLCHHHHKQVRQLLHLASNTLNAACNLVWTWNSISLWYHFFHLQDVCFWRMGSTGNGWCQSGHTWEGVEVHKHSCLPKSWYVYLHFR